MISLTSFFDTYANFESVFPHSPPPPKKNLKDEYKKLPYRQFLSVDKSQWISKTVLHVVYVLQGGHQFSSAFPSKTRDVCSKLFLYLLQHLLLMFPMGMQFSKTTFAFKDSTLVRKKGVKWKKLVKPTWNITRSSKTGVYFSALTLALHWRIYDRVLISLLFGGFKCCSTVCQTKKTNNNKQITLW